jgi:hypothetical protein
MGLFKKKSDPISERTRDLDKEIAKLAKEIRKISHQQKTSPAHSPDSAPEASPQTTLQAPDAAPVENKSSPSKPQPPTQNQPPKQSSLLKPDPSNIPKIGSDAPRLRSTATPDGQTISITPEPKEEAPHNNSLSPEPIFEDFSANPFRPPEEPPSAKEKDQELGIRQDDLASSWKRMKNHLKGPPTNNPELVNYLAAGSIQGLRPLRYERRVARNRFMVLATIFVLILWGILALLLRH